ncbi:MAG: rRNA maturation RNase YbeY [Dethiobacter sp.]|jgi:probable rRNA maturation factor|nr:rRNA maturation RNase YbeY [Dethiobacter sp.]MBS3901692.1 rRNA maturation RNase YbeY [Dethiobacter sp.]MBS3988976.1 rRNA maturation RNase YbeY [Dethiobacter sp.]
MAVSFNIEEGQALPPELLADLERLAEAALLRHSLPAEAEVSLMLCADETIHALNKQWRSVDSPTDVLSFPLLDDEGFGAEGELLLGDVVISLERAASQAVNFGHSVKREILYLFTHGILHLLGYDHHNDSERQKMREMEELLLAVVEVERRGL